MRFASSLVRPVSDRWRELVQRWLQRRAPPSRSVTLDHGKLFILPSRAGMAFLLVVVLLWLLGTNYENNLVFALTFLLVSLFAVLPVHTFANLSGLQLRLLAVRPAFAGDYAEAEIYVSRSGSRAREWLQVGWTGDAGGDGEPGVFLELVERDSAEICVALPVVRRGRVRAPRLTVESRFPLGLFRCWSLVDLDIEFLVYPRPVAAGPLPTGAALGEGDSGETRRGGDDFAGLRAYQPGDSLRHLAWKQYAAGRDLNSKDYESQADARLWLEWDLLAGRDVETRLGNLCHWALQAERANTAYGLRIPGTTLTPAQGPDHLQRVLTALALFPVSVPAKGAR
ncbi:DUF58 domain-containing protein [Microbulbifer magnicolonia]|uniref:DUF58 domain-containing protein n=1 Tax=Microbulbifer magnicolonia TaxID=3109744 RepID=UPI002B416136|nr:DUF58 domain-containing protein [Microbulbifer sp. GG15]